LPKKWDTDAVDYKEELKKRYWTYQRKFFPEIEEYFDRRFEVPRRFVFRTDRQCHNVLVRPGATREECARVFRLLPEGRRHKWFRSMNSSQALALSVLGNLAAYDQLNCLIDLNDDSEEPLLGEAHVSPDNFVMEHEVTYLGEPRCTSLDGFVSGTHQVAIECKFTESEVGSCSRPGLDENETEFCDGIFTRQRGRRERCALTEIGVLYWRYVPRLFKWEDSTDLRPCPLCMNYQLVRNVLAACVRPDGKVSPKDGHVILVYDERNPAFQKGGDGLIAFLETREALRVPSALRRCSWQRIINHLRNRMVLPWLTDQLDSKYGL
jgi:hypothetical protein